MTKKTQIFWTFFTFLTGVCLCQNVRYDAPFPSITSIGATPYLIANTPPSSPVLAVCNTPANNVPCTNYATTYTGSGVACPNGAQDTPQPSALITSCQATGDARGNIGFWAPSGTYDYTVCVGLSCFGPYTVQLISSGGGGTNGEPFVNAGSFSGADICAKITNAISSLSSGGTIQIPPGNYASCTGSGGIGISISKNSVIIEGAGWCNQLISLSCGAVTLNFPVGLTGIDITGSNVAVRNLNLLSADTSSNTDDGIRVRGGNAVLENLSISHFGRNGILTLGNSPTTADSWRYNGIQSYLNFGDGYQWGTPCTDNNLGVGSILVASVNGGWGFNMLCGGENLLESPLVQLNTTGGYNVQASFNEFRNTYCEMGTGSSFIIGNFVGIRAAFNNFGQCSTITNTGTFHTGNIISYTGPDNWLTQNGFYLSSEPGSTGNKSYWFSVSGFATSDLGIYDYSDAQWLFHSNPTNGWEFQEAAKFKSLAFASLGTPVNGVMYYCTDCKNVADDAVTFDSTAVGSGHGTNVLRENGVWRVH